MDLIDIIETAFELVYLTFAFKEPVRVIQIGTDGVKGYKIHLDRDGHNPYGKCSESSDMNGFVEHVYSVDGNTLIETDSDRDQVLDRNFALPHMSYREACKLSLDFKVEMGKVNRHDWRDVLKPHTLLANEAHPLNQFLS